MAQRVSAITNEVQIPFHHGTCPESANSALVAFHSNGADSLHGHAPQDIPKRLSERQAKKIMAMAASSNSAVADKVVVQLRNQNLWKSFRKEETEMIITKTGRRMFPFLDFSLSGLEPDQYYSCTVEIVGTDGNRYRYHKTKGWMATGSASPADPKYCRHVHPNSASLGRYWTEKGASFEKLKVTNHIVNGSGNIVLASMQRYKAQFRLTKLDVHKWDHWVFDFPDTEFITVTSYQNPQIKKLKIDNNPYAKAFRNCKRIKKNQDATADQAKRCCSRFSSPPPITRYQSPFISLLSSQELPPAASAPALPSPPLPPAPIPPPLSHQPWEEPCSTRYIPVYNDITLPWETLDELTSARRHTLPSMSAGFKLEVCGSYTQRQETSRAFSYFEDEFRAPLPSHNWVPPSSSSSSFGSLFDEVQMPAPMYSSSYDHFWREV